MSDRYREIVRVRGGWRKKRVRENRNGEGLTNNDSNYIYYNIDCDFL